MSGVLVLDRSQTRAALDPARVMAAVATALVAIARGEASAPPRIAARTPAGLLGAMPAHVPGLGLAAKLVSVFAAPGRPGGSEHRGVVALFDEHDGRPLALMDAESISAVRTAAVATLSMQALAGPHPARIAVVGTGAQARAQVALLAVVAPGAAVVVGGRSPERARRTAAGHPTASADTVEAAVRGADVVFCCTGAAEPVIRRHWPAEGAHISSVGGSEGPELDPETIRSGSLFAEWAGAAASVPPAGAHELQGVAPDRVTLLGSVLDGRHPGRRQPGELTVFKSTGHAALDVAAASVVHGFARAHGLGTTVDL
ncbi:ornithine cyclodeaminase family protein [Streptacidiphilus griseoplanus]|uniref:ornithine cyclodeaminase family protein n=1 Tax=Peterkaempfera griseoplana TaxID=66896 RepID=UPI0006E1240C|nr:NAD(P)-binding domain-containing protein [Peterkaempfera griseoplana]